MSNTDDSSPQFTLTRTFDAPIERVWRAWTEPEAFHAWLQRMGTRRETVHTDVRPGGRYRYTMSNEATGQTFPTGGEYLEVDEPRMLMFTWGGPDDAVADAFATITVKLEQLADQRTALTFRLVGVAGEAGDGNVYDGWEDALNYLGDSLA